MLRKYEPTAKTTRPSLAGIFLRKRLFRLLNRARDQSVIWISGPGGSGKTTLVASYLDHCKLPCLWYQLDADDADLSTFFYYLGLAAKHAAPRHRKPLPLLTPEYLQAIPAFTRRYFENLYARLTPSFALVFDNYQEVPRDSAFHEVIREAISRAPKDITVFLISRGEPPPSFIRLRANNRFFSVDWNELRLTLDESGGIVKKRKHGLPKEIITQFHARSDGWAAGLVLLAEVYRARGIDLEGPGASAPQEIFDYFAGEVLNKLDSGTRALLLMTSLFPTMTIETANRLTGQDSAGRILSSLNRNRFFIAKHASAKTTYQYHPLFREFLLTRMKESFSDDDVLQIRNRAAALLEETGQIEDAAVLYRDAKNWGQFTALILRNAQTLILQGRGNTLQGWIESVPQPFFEQVPWLRYWLGVCHLPYSPEESRSHFETAFALFKSAKDATGLFLALSGLFDSVIFNFNNFAEYDRLIALLYKLRKEFTEYPSWEIEAHVVGRMLTALYVRQPQHPDLEYWISRGSTLVKGNSDLDGQARVLLMQALIRLFAGELEKTSLILDTLRKTVATRSVTPSAMLVLRDLEASYSWLAGEFDECRRATDEGMALADATGVHTLDIFILGNGAAGALSEDDMKRVDDLLARMRSCLDGRTACWGEALYHNLVAWKFLLQRDPVRASLHADLAIEFGIDSGSITTEVYHNLIKAIVMHELKHENEARACLSEARRICRSMRTYQAEYKYLLTEAQFAFDSGSENAGLDFLRNAMALGREHGYENTFFWVPTVMARLCVQALQAGIEVDYVRDLVRKRALMPDEPPLECENWPWAVKISTLGRFGIERNGKPIRFLKKVPKKPLEMLKALIALGGQAVSETRLNDILWPDADGDSAHRSFNITLIRLRDLLGPKAAVELREGCVTLDKRYVWVDAWALEYNLDAASKAQRVPSFTPDTLQRAISLYTGPFLADENGAWAVSPRERLRGRVISQLERLGRHWEGRKMFVKALDCYRRGLEIDDLTEEFYRRAIFCFLRLGRRAEALSLYRRCEKVLGSYGIKLSSETEAILKSLISK
jgi:LuxR family maltose regulon positive regulatory protein